ncbi:MAG: D-TA family PLP-dependent enzyme, partial [Armatimonadota bacterium]
GLTEIRPGTYVFYDRNQVDIGSAPMEQVALSVLSTVVATPTRERAIIDAGTKGLAQQVGGLSDGYGWLPDVAGAVVNKVNDEHGFVDVSAAERPLKIGEKLRVIPARAPTCVNLYDWIHATRDGMVEDVWRVAARGRNT